MKENANDFFDCGGSGNITVSYSCDGGHREVRRYAIQVHDTFVLESSGLDPTITLINISSDEDPEAPDKMTQQEQDQNKEWQSLESCSQFKWRAKVFHDLILVFHEFEKAEESRDFDELVEFADPGNSDELITTEGTFIFAIGSSKLTMLMRSIVQDQIERGNS